MSSDYIKLIKSNCKNCHKCIKSCPVKSIRFSSGQADIIAEECLLCGQCFVVCPHRAKEIRSDVPAVKAAIASGAKVYASIAPSFAANYKGASIASMRTALMGLGFTDALETAVGASIVKTRYQELIAQGAGGGVLISSCCPVVNDYIRMYETSVLPHLADVVTPAEAHSRLIKGCHPDAVTVFIGPCIAKKRESDRSSMIDLAITFSELSHWLADESILIEPMEDQDELNTNSRARLFPTSSGVLRTMIKDPKWSYVTIDGMDNCKRALREIKKGELENCFIEMSACAGSCVGGPVMERMRSMPIGDNAMIDAYAGKKDFIVEQPDGESIAARYQSESTRRVHIADEQITATLKLMGKTTPEQELNCGFCGYDTCREKALAVCLGKAEIDMCLPYLMDKAQSLSDIIIKNSPYGVIALNEELKIQQLNDAACAIMNIKKRSDVYGEPVVTVLDPKPIMDVVHSNRVVKNQPAYLAEYRRYVELTVVYERNYRIIIVIMRDITSQEASRTHQASVSSGAIETADRVIDNQMRVVQEIASLLGETAAETKIALTKLKESMQKDE